MKSLTLATMSGIALFVICGTTAQAHRTAAVESIVTIDVPGAIGTWAEGINDRGDVVGYYVTSDFTSHGFLLKDGVFTLIDVPGATYTDALGINNRGDIVGRYIAPSQPTHAFLLRHGIFTTIEVPTTGVSWAHGINDRGDIVGVYVGSSAIFPYGFLLDRRGVFSALVYPPNGPSTQATGINARGDIVGFYPDLNERRQLGFLRDQGGAFTTIDIPSGSLQPTGINTRGEVVGYYFPEPGPTTSFVKDQYGNVTFFDVPGSYVTFAQGINDRGNIVGAYFTTERSHGFVLNRDNGDHGDGDH